MVMKVLKRAITMNEANISSVRMPTSRPMLSTMSSTRPFVFSSTPTVSDSLQKRTSEMRTKNENQERTKTL